MAASMLSFLWLILWDVQIRVGGRIRFVYATCGRRYFWIRIKKCADTKISGYLWTWPKSLNNRILCQDVYSRRENLRYFIMSLSQLIQCKRTLRNLFIVLLKGSLKWIKLFDFDFEFQRVHRIEAKGGILNFWRIVYDPPRGKLVFAGYLNGNMT